MKPITIVGGGLAGLTLGILLRREAVQVAVVEAGNYPRHRVCGEFLSGRGREILSSIGIEEKLSGKLEARNCSFHLPNRRPVPIDLENPALCVSRYNLDAVLADEFQAVGGILKTGERVADSTSEGVVRATGRRRSTDGKGKLFGLKAHAADVALSSDLEMHFGDRHYVGISRLPNAAFNVCGLFFSEQPVREGWKNVLEKSVFSECLRSARWAENSFCSVAGLTLDREVPDDSFSIGDAAAMIPPLTGNGMSMAFESAEAALPFVRKYAGGEISWAECLAAHNQNWRAQFSGRLRWASFVQRIIFRPAGQSFLYAGARLFPGLPQFFFVHTR
ncbi:MAG TPA: FAD-dependent monooxygenase [Verrucomicrobiae bacterium]|nr:FAD-dependent monooxygenase [Verrucomicrobiae bacterium]